MGIGRGVFAKPAKSCASWLERVEVFEARTHPAGLRVSGSIETAVRLGHRMRRIGREVVPEVLEIDAFATRTSFTGVRHKS